MHKNGRSPIVRNVADMRASHKRACALTASRQHVIPGHDPLLLKRYRALRCRGTGVRLAITNASALLTAALWDSYSAFVG